MSFESQLARLSDRGDIKAAIARDLVTADLAQWLLLEDGIDCEVLSLGPRRARVRITASIEHLRIRALMLCNCEVSFFKEEGDIYQLVARNDILKQMSPMGLGGRV